MLSDTTGHDAGGDGYRIEVAGGLDRHAAEALRLELERLAKTEGIALTVTIRRAETAPESS